MSNQIFSNLLEFALYIADRFTSSEEERAEFLRLNEMFENEEFWRGRGLTIEDDFPQLGMQKYWSKIFLETAQSVFLREVGDQSNMAWQAQMIYFAHATAALFLSAVHQAEPGWYPQTRVTKAYNAIASGEG